MPRPKGSKNIKKKIDKILVLNIELPIFDILKKHKAKIEKTKKKIKAAQKKVDNLKKKKR